MAGAGYRVFSAGAVLTAAQVNTFLMEQSVMNFAGTAARGSALASVLSAGQMAHVGGGTVTVYDGSAWQQVYPAQAGLVYVAGTAFSAVSSVSVNNCFTSTYQNYAVVITSKGSADANLQVRMRVSGSDNSTSNYRYARNYRQYAGTNDGVSRSAADTSFLIGGSNTNSGSGTLIAHDPQSSAWTVVEYMGSSDNYSDFTSGVFAATTQFDGFTLYPSTGTISGTVRVYGYRNS